MPTSVTTMSTLKDSNTNANNSETSVNTDTNEATSTVNDDDHTVVPVSNETNTDATNINSISRVF